MNNAVSIKSNKYLEIPEHSKYLLHYEGIHVIKKKDGKEISTHLDKNGYICVGIYNDIAEKFVTTKMHRIVALSFLGPEPIYENSIAVVNHKDGVKTNNHPDNLEWCSVKENNEHAWLTGLMDAHYTGISILYTNNKNQISYRSIRECSTALNISDTCLLRRLTRGPNKVWPPGVRLRKRQMLNLLLCQWMKKFLH
jgi:hypothetical protein